jgi:ubiquitin-like-conjugating enzyme ATG3
MLGIFQNTREWMMPVLKESAFIERGVLTPEEFVRAGDQLVRTCPTWQWESGEPSKIRDYLPPKKQFLSTRGIPSYRRVSTLNATVVHDQILKGGMGEEEGDWCAPELIQGIYLYISI